MITIFERLYPNWGQYFQEAEVIFSERTPSNQNLLLVDTKTHGRVLLLDNVVQLTEKGNASYHEMMVHPVLFGMEKPAQVLIIGGGDGGTLKEVLRHRTVESVVLVEIDESVITFSQKYFPTVGGDSFQDPRVRIVVADGAKYIAETTRRFDVILVDSTDPTPGSSDVLFTTDFYRQCQQKLTEGGVLVVQAGVPRLQSEELQSIISNLCQSNFTDVHCLLVDAPDYCGGMMALALARNGLPIAKIQDLSVLERIAASKFVAGLHYYNLEIHQSCFALPNYLKKMLG